MMLMRWAIILLSLACLGARVDAGDLKPIPFYAAGAGADYAFTKHYADPWDRDLSFFAKEHLELTVAASAAVGYGVDRYLARKDKRLLWAWRGFYFGAKFVAVLKTARSTRRTIQER